MPKTPSNKLFKLIKSLNGSEKRYFKLYSNAKNDNKVNKYILLFDAIDLQETYDEQSLRNIIYKGEAVQTRKFSELKNYLYELLLKSLQAYDEKISIDYKLKRLMQSVRVLFKRSHYNECKELLRKARGLAVKYEHFMALLEILRWEKKIAYAQIDIAFLDQDMGRIEKEEKNALGKLQNLSALQNMFFRMLIHIDKYTSGRDDKQLGVMLHEFIQQPLLASLEKAKSYPARLWYYRIYTLYYATIYNWEGCYKTSKAMLTLMDSKSEMIKEYTTDYIAGLSKLTRSCVFLEKYDEVGWYLEKIKGVDAVAYDDSLKIHIAYYLNKFAFCIATGNFAAGLEALKKHEADRTGFDERYFSVDTFYYNYSYIYFGAGHYKEALVSLEKWLKLSPSNGKLDLYRLARVLQLVVCYELGDPLLMGEVIQQVHRYQKKQKCLSEFEGALLNFFKEVNKIADKEMEQASFVQLKVLFLKLLAVPSERPFFKLFNFMTWVESKVNSQAFSDLVRKQYLSKMTNK